MVRINESPSNGSLHLIVSPIHNRATSITESRNPCQWIELQVHDLREAEDLLDCVVSQGYSERELSVLPSGEYLVRWRN